MKESIFENVDLEGFMGVSCTKNISDFGDGKFITISLQYSNGDTSIKIGSSCVRNKDLSLNVDESVKVLMTKYGKDSELKLTHRVWPSDLCDVVKQDLDIVEEMFNNFNDDLKRVYL